jgi:hypothetical protein
MFYVNLCQSCAYAASTLPPSSLLLHWPALHASQAAQKMAQCAANLQHYLLLPQLSLQLLAALLPYCRLPLCIPDCYPYS